MKGVIAIIAALPGELRPLVKHPSAKRWKRLPSAKGIEIWEFRHRQGKWLAVCAGMGPDRAGVAFAEALKHGSVDAIFSIGWAGALRSELLPGSLVSPSMVIDTRTGEHFRPAVLSSEDSILVSSPIVAGRDEKARLAESYAASAVDMEAATIARLAQANGIPFHVIKAISDAADTELLEFDRFTNPSGQLRLGPLLAHVLLRPWTWPGLIRLGRNSSRGAKRIAGFLYDWLDQGAHARNETALHSDP